MVTLDHPGMDDHNTTSRQLFTTPLVSLKLMDTFFIANNFIFTLPFSLLGVSTNIANIIVYYRMGFSESSNANFLVLSAFDLLVSIFSFTGRLLYNPFLRDISTGPITMYISHCLSHAMTVFMGGSSMMTALIAVERCVCVVFPLKVRPGDGYEVDP
ncbi:chemosensory receptor A [Elysia marginata]|uniref:Chemosensory receptor A n=1 Tax=Elysia marginata TaxID=1093978 RepID=A0AAV4GEL6_9GAST|nr:chemosensory receptor A [Elysia marginata]